MQEHTGYEGDNVVLNKVKFHSTAKTLHHDRSITTITMCKVMPLYKGVDLHPSECN